MKSAKSGCTSAKSKLSAFGLHRLYNVNEQLEVAARGDVKQKRDNDKNQEKVFYESGTGICQSGPTATGADALELRSLATEGTQEPLPDAQTGRQRSG